jgi:hypothetical protein
MPAKRPPKKASDQATAESPTGIQPKRSSSAQEISRILTARIQESERARDQQTQIFRDCYLDYMGRPRLDDTDGTGGARAVEADQIFVRQSRAKVRSVRARLKDSLFGAGTFPLDTQPTGEQLKEYTDAVEDVLLKLIEESGLQRVVEVEAIDGLCVYGTDLIAGPFVKDASIRKFEVAYEDDGNTKIVEKVFRCDLPQFLHMRQVDTYPDKYAEDENDGRGIAWATRHEKHSLRAKLKKQGGYYRLADAFASSTKILSLNAGSQEIEANSTTPPDGADDRAEVIHYFGLLPKSLVKAFGSEEYPDYDEDDLVEAITVLVNGVAVKCGRAEWLEERPAYRCCYETTPHEFWGVGPVENNFSQQKITNMAFRLYLEGKGYALLKTATVDRNKFLPTEDFERFPGKLYETRPGLTPEEIKSAIIYHDVVDVTQGWESVIAISERFSDDETSISKYTMGNDAGHLNETATGISMIMNAGQLPTKEVLQNIDRNWVVRPVRQLLNWAFRYLDPETVIHLCGEEIAVKWAAVQRFWRENGHTQFLGWRATGASTFVAKEILLTKLQGFLQIVATNPAAAQFVDMRELLEQVWDAGQVNKESVVYDEETVKQMMESAPKEPSAVEVLQMQLEAKMNEVSAKIQGDLQAKMAEVEAKLQIASQEHSARMRELDIREKELDIELLKLKQQARKPEQKASKA